MSFQNLQSEIQNPKSKIIRVLLVDDSPIALTVLKRILASSPDIEVVGTAKDGKEALELIPRLNPTVICTDLHMPVMDGLEFTERVMAEHPTPILAVSVSVSEGSANVFNLLEAGAIDVFQKPRGGLNSEAQVKAAELIQKVRILAGVKVFRRRQKEILDVGLRIADLKSKIQIPKSEIGDLRIVVIGASTGGPQALHSLLSVLPANFPIPVVCVQHIGDEFLTGFIEWLSSQCRIKVRIAESGEFPQPGTIYFPQAGLHLKVDNNGRFFCSEDPPYDGHRPSISVMFKSVADFYGSSIIALLLTGMGRDGAEGMQAVSRAGGITIAQDEESSIVFGMPKAAIELEAAKHIMTPDEMAETLLAISNQRSAVSKDHEG